MRTITDHLQTIDGVSESIASDIVDRFSSYEDLAAASVDDLRAVKGVGPVLATRIQAAAIEASPAAATKAATSKAAASARTNGKKAASTTKKTATTAKKSASSAGKKAASSVSARADKSSTAAKAATSRARTRAAEAVDDATDTAADVADTAADVADTAADTATRANKDFADSIERRTFGPFTLPANLPWPVNFALDTTEAVVSVGLKVTTGVLHTVGRKLR